MPWIGAILQNSVKGNSIYVPSKMALNKQMTSSVALSHENIMQYVVQRNSAFGEEKKIQKK